MKRSILFLAALALLVCGVGQARADFYSVSTGYVGGVGTMTVPGFDTSKGTLTGVSIQIIGSDFLDCTFSNPTPETVTGTVTLTGNVFVLGPDTPPTTASASGMISTSVTIPPDQTAFGFSGNATLSGSGAFVPTSGLSSYETATVTLSGADVIITSGPVEFDSVDAHVNATATLTYTFNSAVPEPAALTLLAIGAVGLLGYGWRARRWAAP
jgi:hypothetical protein